MLRLALLSLVLLAVPALAQRGDKAGEAQPDLPADLDIPAAPPLPPEEALETLRLAEPGLRVTLAASEPMIADPVSAVFDADGRLWVVEMQSYMPNVDGEGELEPTSRVVVLEDADGDGAFESGTTFMDGLVLPRSVLPCYGGALVLAPPKLLFARDTDGDGRADEVRELLDGFGGLDNPEHAGNGLLYGLDNWIHFSQHGIEVRFDGERVETRRVPGHGQWGLTQDDDGRLYYAPNSDVLRGDLYPKHYASRNPNQRAVRGLNITVANDRAVYPARMNPGINRGYQEPMLRDDFTLARMTAACSPLIYRSVAWGDGFYGNGFVCEPAGNCVKRVLIEERDAVPVAQNAYGDTEFLTSTDERFRPVAQAVGPDGSLYVVDMYRGVIQHKTYVTTFLRKQVEARELERPIHMGRIWRVSGPGRGSDAPRRLSALDTGALVGLLGATDSFHRLHAQRLLIERRATEAAPALRRLAHDESASALARIHALWTLEGLGEFTREDAWRAIATVDERVLVHAARLFEPFIESPDDVRALADAHVGAGRAVHLQAALSLGASRWPEATDELGWLLLRHAEDDVLRSAVVSGLHEREVAVLLALAPHVDAAAPKPLRDTFAETADAALRGSPAQRARYLDLAAELLGSNRAAARLLIDRLAAEQRLDSDSPRTLALDAEPGAWTAALARGMWDLHSRAVAVTGRLTWPGHDGASESVTPLTLAEREMLIRGRSLFDTCAACHGYDGRGMLGQAPPLAGSDLVLGDETRLASLVIHGLEGPIERDGVAYDAQMPPAPFQADRDIAAVLTYIRRSFGNGVAPVSVETIARVREETSGRGSPWTEDELLRAHASDASGGASAAGGSAPDRWASLFDGASIDGWVLHGGRAVYTVEDGAIVGETRPNEPNTFLCTPREYGDFVLELEVRLDPGLNSGIQIRSRPTSESRSAPVHGYQIEIEDTPRGYAGGVYDEGGRGWLAPPPPEVASDSPFIAGEWNRYRIEAIGDTIRTWINDAPVAELTDDAAASGIIGLQVHGVGGRAEPMRVRWRNIRIREIE